MASPVLVSARRVHSPPATFRQAHSVAALPATLTSVPCSYCASGGDHFGKCVPRNIPSRVLRPVNGDAQTQQGPWLMEPLTARQSVSQPQSFTAPPGPRHLQLREQFRTSSPRQIRGMKPFELDDEYRDRRPTDPFFYPTTVSPLTGLGLNLIEESMPQEKAEERSFVGFSDLEDLSILQRQNDELAKHMQDLERAKSLAAMTSAQALQKIRQRQEQLRKEQQQCMVKAKEIQADPGLAEPPADVEGPVVQPGAQERRLPGKPEDIGQTQVPQPAGISSTSSTLRRSEALDSKRFARPMLSSSSDTLAVEGSTKKPEAPGDITAMAATMLSTHSAPNGSTPCGLAPYVDALGNPLPPIRNLDDLPNIKDAPNEVPSENEGPISTTSALIQVDPPLSEEPAETPRSKARSARVEKPLVVVTHERGPAARSERQGSHSSAGSRALRPSAEAAEGSKNKRKEESDRRNRRRSSEEPESKAGSTQLPPEVAEELQAELDECLDTIKWCASSVTRDSLQDVKSTNRPAPVVKDVLEAVSILLAQPETRWDRLKQMIKPQFFDKLHRLDFQRSVSKEQFKKLRDKLANPHFDEELIKTVSVPMVPLAMWCRAIGVYLSKTKYRGGPEIRPVAGSGATPAPRYQERKSSVAMTIYPDLSMMDEAELRHVRDLTVSREGVGTITFEGETDCTGLDFETIVRLEVGEVLVYPQPGKKPEVGVGLNKAATVTMYQCWPPNGSILAQDKEQQEEYKRRIKVMTEEKKARFIDYDCTTGVWKFAVEHF